MILNSPYISGSLTVTGNIIASGSITLSGSVASASYATNAELLDGLDSTAFATTGAYSATSASLYATSASLSATSGSLSATSGSLSATSGSLSATSGSLSTASGSFDTRVTALEATGSALSSSLLTVSGSGYATSASLSDASGSFNTRVATIESKYATTGSNTFIGTQVVSGSILQSGSFTSTGTLTAQTLVIQTITSSVVYSSGSNVFGNSLGNSQVFTGSVLITGSLTIAGASSATSYNGATIFGSTIACSPIGCFATSCATSFIGGTMSGTTIYGSTAVCSPLFVGGVINGSGFCTSGGIVGNNSNNLYLSSNSAAGEISFWGNQLNTRLMTLTGCGSLGIGVAAPRSILEVLKTTGNTSLGVASNFNLLLSQGGAINEYSQIGFGYTSTNSPAVIGYITTCATDYTKGSLIFATRDAVTDTVPTERMRITSTGAIGIGTTNPINFFEAYSNCTTNLAYFTTSGSANRMIIGATNVGNGSLIDVRAHGSVYTESIFGMCATNTTAVIGTPASGCAMLVGTIVNSPLVFGTCNAERLRITNTGAATFACGVNINGLATSANYKLGATGAAFISGTNSKGVFITDTATYASIVGLNSAISTYNKLELRASGTDGQIMLHTTGNVSIGNPTDTGDQLYLAGNLKMTTNGKIDSNGGYLLINSATGGSVGIGNTPANAKLYVYDIGCTVSLGFTCFYNQARGIDIYNSNSGTTNNVVGLWISTGPHKAGIASGRTCAETTWEVDLRFYTHPTTVGTLDGTCENMRLYGDGSLVTRGGTSTPGLYSDINLKENLLRIPFALNKIKCINGYMFDWKDTAPSRSTPDLLNIIHDAGLIAQEVEEVMPDIVRSNDLSCTKMLNYNGITALLVEGIKEQQCIINTLKTCLGII